MSIKLFGLLYIFSYSFVFWIQLTISFYSTLVNCMSVLLPFELVKYVQYKISCWNVQVVRERVDTLLLWRAQAEARAEFAERSVQKLQKEVDRLEGMSLRQFIKYPKQNISFSNKYNYYFQLKYIKLCIFFNLCFYQWKYKKQIFHLY